MESQENQYRWPKAEAIYPDRPGRSYALKRLRYRLRSFLHQGSIVHFEQFVNQHPFLVTLLNEHADYSYPLVYRFLDKRFNSKQRFQAICDNLLFLPEKLTALSWLFAHVAIFCTVLMTIAVFLVIGNSIRSDVYSSRASIDVMKLLGATDQFILRPYLYTILVIFMEMFRLRWAMRC